MFEARIAELNRFNEQNPVSYDKRTYTVDEIQEDVYKRQANYLDFIDRFEADPVEALQPVCAPFTEAEYYSWFIYVREQMVERYGTAEQMEE